ncbi:MAG: twin-arginine translocase subunit TatC [Candidatus Omnitrophica bacterium]|nr:twin-arginine translocase subunit TatC [Candidatus Omnitrophota bacterium]
MAFEFFSHLEELRSRLIKSFVLFLIIAAGAYFFSDTLLEFFTEPLRRIHQSGLYFHKPYDAFLIHLQIAALTGLIISSPFLFLQAWLFVAPGLYEKEKKSVYPVIFISTVLFLTGVCFAYYMVIPWGLQFLLSFQTEMLQPLLSVDEYFSFLIGMIVAFGLLFNFPVIVVGIVKLGIMSADDLARARKGIVVIIFILAAVLTPSPDPLSQLMLAAPLLILFEVSLIAARWKTKRRTLEIIS